MGRPEFTNHDTNGQIDATAVNAAVGNLNIRITGEGIIFDAFQGDAEVGTWAVDFGQLHDFVMAQVGA